MMRGLFLLGCILVFIYSCFLYKQHRRASREEAPVVWSWLPYIGSALRFGAGALEFVSKARERYGDFFVVIILGRRILFVCDEKVGRIATTRTPALQFTPVSDDVLMKAFGLERHHIFSRSELDAKLHKQYVQYLLRDNGFAALKQRAEQAIARILSHSFQERALEQKMIDLYTFIKGIVFQATVDTFYGVSFLEKEPNLLAIFDDFDQAFPGLVAGFPLPKGRAAYAKLASLFSHRGYEHAASDFIRARAQAFQERSTTTTEAAAQTALLWGTLANSIPACFWTLYYIIKKQDTSIQKECLNPDSPYLDAALTEALRLTSGSLILRETLVPTRLSGSILLRANDRLAVFPPLHHLDPHRFPSPLTFHPDRWLQEQPKEDEKTSVRDYALLPEADTILITAFGAGASMCPGRRFARFEIKLIVSKLLECFQFDLISPEAPRPKLVVERAGLGIYPPASEVPVKVSIRSNFH